MRLHHVSSDILPASPLQHVSPPAASASDDRAGVRDIAGAGGVASTRTPPFGQLRYVVHRAGVGLFVLLEGTPRVSRKTMGVKRDGSRTGQGRTIC
jgi:hypothetical protein